MVMNFNSSYDYGHDENDDFGLWFFFFWKTMKTMMLLKPKDIQKFVSVTNNVS